jgi:hypothetical protein
MSNFPVLSQHSPGGIEENSETCYQGKLIRQLATSADGNYLIDKLPVFVRIIREAVNGFYSQQFQPSHITCFANCMKQSPSLEAHSHLACQEILCLLWHQKVQYHAYKSLSLVAIFNHMNSVHNCTQYVGILNTACILILSSHPCLVYQCDLFPSDFPI